MNAEHYNREMDREIRLKRSITAAMLYDFGLAYTDGSASSASWLVGKIGVAKEILRSGGSIEILEAKPIVFSSVQALEKWVCERYPDFADDL
jgi:hypothetical protein